RRELGHLALLHRVGRRRDRGLRTRRPPRGNGVDRDDRRPERVASPRNCRGAASPLVPRVRPSRDDAGCARRRQRESDRRNARLRTRRHESRGRGRLLRTESCVGRLRAKCPSCGTFTAVALGPDYECHSCGREFRAGMVRVPRAWGDGGEEMIESAMLPLAYPEAGVIEEPSLRDQTLALASELPERPLILGGCCCSHVGAVEGLAARHERLAVVWLDAHGDLNTPESSPSGNAWGMPLRMILDAGPVRPHDVALLGP